MAASHPTVEYSFSSGEILRVRLVSNDHVLPFHCVAVSIGNSVVQITQPALFTASGPTPTDSLAVIREAIRVLLLSATVPIRHVYHGV